MKQPPITASGVNEMAYRNPSFYGRDKGDIERKPIMRLYHGSNVSVEHPKILHSDRKLDFGTGFYLTSSFEQAERWSVLTARRRKSGFPVITVYEADEKAMELLKVHRFDGIGYEWLRYVSANRKDIELNDDSDIVVGPVANDRTMPVISLYFAGIYDENETIKRLLPQKLRDQYAFKTEKALELLTLKEVIQK